MITSWTGTFGFVANRRLPMRAPSRSIISVRSRLVVTTRDRLYWMRFSMMSVSWDIRHSVDVSARKPGAALELVQDGDPA